MPWPEDQIDKDGNVKLWPRRREMCEYERRIREKVYAANILTLGEWIYLLGCLQAAHEE